MMRTISKKLFALALVATAMISFTSCEKDDEPTNQTPQLKTIAAIASENNNFSILVDALTRADLVDAVNDPNANLTVFAPNNIAFQDLLTELGLPDLDAVENALGTDGLKNVLLYHVLGAEVKSDMVETGYAASLATNGTDDALSMYISAGSSVRINDRATVQMADLDASNGVIHEINKVILPQTIYELLAVNPEFSSLVTAIGAADGDLDMLFMDEMSGPYTLFAPDNDGFGDALQELQLADLNALVAQIGTDGVADVLTYHAVNGNINSDEVPTGAVPTVNGESITISVSNGVKITDINAREVSVEEVDIQGTNGVIHRINNVLLPI